MHDRTCPECAVAAKSFVRGYCTRCYNRLCAAGKILPRRRNKRVDFEAWLASVVDTEGCWIWPGSLNNDGYGRVQINGKREHVHNIVYRRLVGLPPPGTEPDHLCRNRACANPGHLDPVTHHENLLRGECPAARHARATHCPKGHPYSGDNLYIRSNGRWRDCRQCMRLRNAAKRSQATHSELSE